MSERIKEIRKEYSGTVNRKKDPEFRVAIFDLLEELDTKDGLLKKAMGALQAIEINERGMTYAGGKATQALAEIRKELGE